MSNVILEYINGRVSLAVDNNEYRSVVLVTQYLHERLGKL